VKIYNSRSLIRFISAAAVFCAINLSHAATVQVGDSFPRMPSMQDQHEQAYSWPTPLRHVAVSFSMTVGKAANGYFEAKGADYLTKNDAVFVANIYGMPAVGRFFAMPKMRKYPHRIMLADAENVLSDFPQQEEKVTVFDLDSKGQIQGIRYWDPKTAENPF